jgi:hypothetical protein
MTSLGGCSVFQDLFSSSKSGGPSQVSDLVGRIERVYVEAELSKQAMHTAVAGLETIASGDLKGDPSTAYAAYLEALEASEGQARTLRETYEPLKEAAVPFFQQWTDNLKEYDNPDIRLRSQSRLAATRQRYEAIVAAVEPAMADYDTINKGLRDYALFLGHDLNPSALSEIQDGVAALVQRAGMVERGFDACLVAARAYVDASSLPAQASAEPKVQPVSGAGG